MTKNKEIAVKQLRFEELTQQQVQAEVDDLYNELEKQYGAGFADFIMRRYTNVQPRQRGERS